MTSSVTITAHPAKSSDGTPLKVDIVEFDGEDVVKETFLENGETYTCSVWEGRSVIITESTDYP